jgi:translation initiation factor IF-2
MTASCRRRSRRSITPRRPSVPIIVAINKIDKPTPIRSACAPNCCSTKSRSKTWAATSGVEGLRHQDQSRQAAREAIAAAGRNARPQGQSRPQRRRRRDRSQARRGRGPVATVLVKRGTLKVGDIVVAGAEWGRVRALINDRANRSTRPAPRRRSKCWASTAAPEAGDRLAVVENEARAREVTEYRARRSARTPRPGGRHARLAEQMMTKLKTRAARNCR